LSILWQDDEAGMRGPIRYLFFAAAFSLILAGCGYQVHRRASLPFTEINIAPIANGTLEPKLQDKMHRALTEEFVKQGFSISHSALYTLTGKVSKFELYALSSKAGVTVDYRVVVEAVFNLVDHEGKVMVTRTFSGPFIVSLSGSGDLASLLAAKETAEETACRNIALEVAGALIYR
jgi:outer membrane lipopolysaccharide assembly protein LptE/RlpB